MRRDDDRLQRLVLGLGPVTVSFRTPSSLEDGPFAIGWSHLAGPLNTPCNETLEADHLMLLIGWTPDYWIFKNSYGVKGFNGTVWGVDGFVYLNRSLAQGCGIFGNGLNKKTKGGDGYFTGQFTFPILE